jgi:sugar phosphate isomerase/epimerase
MKIGCVSASYVADLVGYPGQIDWERASQAIIQAPILETVRDLLIRLKPARLDGFEFWFPHVWPAHLTPVLAGEIQKLLAQAGMVCYACAGSVSHPERDPYGARASFQTARLLEAPLIAGHFEPAAASALGELGAHFGVRLAFENGGERELADIEAAIQGSNQWVGFNLDTGNFAAQGGDPVEAVYRLGSRLLHLHLKDVPGLGSHDCVALGTGIVDFPGVIKALKTCDYTGWLSIEIETGDHDPSAEIIASAEAVRGWLSG